MGSVFLIVLRETLEATIVIGILLAFLSRAGLDRLKSAIWAGALAGIAASLGVAALFLAVAGEFEGRAEQLFEGLVMLLGAALLTSLILWIDRGDIRSALERRGAASAGRAGSWGIALLVFASILREGVETVIFLGASLRGSGALGIASGLIGLGAALALGLLIFAAGKRISLRRFFAATNLLLLLFAAGLVGRAAGEFSEAGLLPPIVDRLWDLNPPVAAGAAFPAFHEEGAIGSFLKGLFGYSASPSLLTLLAYGSYLFAVALLLLVRRRKAGQTRVSEAHAESATP
jgi:high-affinity iron transporter